MMGMAGILERLGKTVQSSRNRSAPNLRFLDPERRIKRLGTDVAIESLESIEVLLVLDTSAWAQLGDMGELIRATKAKKAVLDHHVSSDDLGAELFKDTTAEATGRLVAEAAEHLNVALAPDIARPLFAALTTDTGWFRFASTTSETLRLGARLMDAGAVPDELYKQLYENESLGRFAIDWPYPGSASNRARRPADLFVDLARHFERRRCLPTARISSTCRWALEGPSSP